MGFFGSSSALSVSPDKSQGAHAASSVIASLDVAHFYKFQIYVNTMAIFIVIIVLLALGIYSSPANFQT